MKKIISFCVSMTLATACAGSGIAALAQDVSEEDCDVCFRQTVTDLMGEEGYESTVLQAQKQPVYDIYANHLGYVYDFEAAGENGFAIIIYDENVGAYTASEVYMHGNNPYAHCAGTPLYITQMTYWSLDGGAYTDIPSGARVPDEVVDYYEEFAFTNTYEGGVQFTTETVSVVYTSRNKDEYTMATRCPDYIGGTNMTNGCAAVAGGNLLGYFDRYYEDLIPNHKAGTTFYGLFLYSGEDDYVHDAMYTLYSYMDISSEHGATEASFKSGMTRYCTEKGRSISFTSCMSGGSLNYATAVQKMKSGQPLALFLNTYNFASIEEGETTDYYYYHKYLSNHVMVGFGSSQITYTLSDGSTQINRLILVATGLTDLYSGYFNVNYHNNTMACYAVNIY